jgi:hypothetical protein
MVMKEGAGRVRLANGARMSLRSYREAMVEQYPIPAFTAEELDPEFGELVADVRTLRKDVDRLRGHIEPREALMRAQSDAAAGRLVSDAPGGLKRHAAEADLWS